MTAAYRDIVAIVGPTASGKTALAVEVAERLGTEIISADSMQLYRGMAIGTGAPSAEELARVKHHFIGFLEPRDDFCAGAFEEQARGVAASLNARDKPAVVVGGSGLYVSALIDGLFAGPGKDARVRQRLKEEAEERGAAALYARLVEVDPEYARAINAKDLRRIVRALEVYELAGAPMSALHREHRESAAPMDAVQVALDWPRDELYARINVRVDRMIEQGFLEEVQRLLDTGHGPDIERLRSLGYREVAAHLRGECTIDAAAELVKVNTRRYAKRQLTWFRGDPRVQWLPVGGGHCETQKAEYVLALINQPASQRPNQTLQPAVSNRA